MEANEQNNQYIDPKTINPRCSCFNLRKTTRAVTQFFDHQLEPAGIRATQFTLLVAMDSVSARTLTEMAHTLVMDRTTLTRNLKPLEKLGFIQTMEPRDKRSKAYGLTEKGKETLLRGVPLWNQAQMRIETALGDERFGRILEDLDAITKIISEM